MYKDRTKLGGGQSDKLDKPNCGGVGFGKYIDLQEENGRSRFVVVVCCSHENSGYFGRENFEFSKRRLISCENTS